MDNGDYKCNELTCDAKHFKAIIQATFSEIIMLEK